MSWRLFDREAEHYESWYETARGRRASLAETRLLGWLLATFPGASTILEVGCGSGHFLAGLEARGYRPIGLDRAPRMLAFLRRRRPALPALVADAHALPLRAREVDLVLFVTTLEFLEDPSRALAEAARVARLGVLVIALNRWSLGALSRRFGRGSRSTLLRHARDLTPRQARRLVAQAAGARLGETRARSALLPAFPAGVLTRIPFGDVLGVAALVKDGPIPRTTGRRRQARLAGWSALA